MQYVKNKGYIKRCCVCGDWFIAKHAFFTTCDEHRKSESRIYNTSFWKKARQDILERDNYICGYCGGQAVTADHVIARAKGGLTIPSNLIATCNSCNSKKFTNTIDVLVKF